MIKLLFILSNPWSGYYYWENRLEVEVLTVDRYVKPSLYILNLMVENERLVLTPVSWQKERLNRHSEQVSFYGSQKKQEDVGMSAK